MLTQNDMSVDFPYHSEAVLKGNEMKLRLKKVGISVFPLLLVMLFLPRSARADYTYEFSGSYFGKTGTADFSFTVPSLFRTTGTFSTSFKLKSETFTKGYFNASSDCFVFATSGISGCNDDASNSFYGVFGGATRVGTYTESDFECAASTTSKPCVLLSSLTISSNSVSATPEPESFVLLGTGVLGFAGVVRRRLRLS